MKDLGPVSLSRSLQFYQQQSTERWELSSGVQAVAEGTGLDGIIQLWQCVFLAPHHLSPGHPGFDRVEAFGTD